MQTVKLTVEQWKIDEVIPWDKNPRKLTNNGLENLMKQIEKQGQYKPIIVNSGEFWGERGLIAGGNQRYKAMKLMGFEDITVALIHPKSENDFIEIALSDNDRAGYTDIDMLGNLVTTVDFDLSRYSIDISPAVNLDFFIHPPEFDPNKEWEGMPEFNQKDTSAFKQVIVNFENQAHMEAFAKLIGQDITIKTKSIWYPEHKMQRSKKVYKHES